MEQIRRIYDNRQVEKTSIDKLNKLVVLLLASNYSRTATIKLYNEVSSLFQLKSNTVKKEETLKAGKLFGTV
jgi:hypothetical protein